ncbi:hypothetical protein MKQ70_30510 [Chitinophaga sedimenti]|uniref:AbiJ-NTD4 domain-containing protein n=1 Tax=Chitinophaga sedimenti TaxID=2033606 RepID=UPI002004C51B|nr:hypothetical protein [Chitinophaga sedimenti]MCK7559077.1 hypothetical protein [Chitinophaga sedimenti]
MKFSQRMGITTTHKQIQVEALDLDLRNTLWNVFQLSICDPLKLTRYKHGLEPIQESIAKYLWHNIYKKPIDTIPHYQYLLRDFFRNNILEGEWHQALELIEETVNYLIKTIS